MICWTFSKFTCPILIEFESSNSIGYLTRVDYIFVVKIFLLKNYSTFSFLLDIQEHRDKIYSKELFLSNISYTASIDFWLSMIFA